MSKQRNKSWGHFVSGSGLPKDLFCLLLFRYNGKPQKGYVLCHGVVDVEEREQKKKKGFKLKGRTISHLQKHRGKKWCTVKQRRFLLFFLFF
jgi:hypothetical protein